MCELSSGKASDGDACCKVSSIRRVLSSSEWSDSKQVSRHSPSVFFKWKQETRAGRAGERGNLRLKLVFLDACLVQGSLFVLGQHDKGEQNGETYQITQDEKSGHGWVCKGIRA